jgi:hypothetical protein
MRPLRLTTKVRSGGTVHLDALPLREGQTVEVILHLMDESSDDFSALGESGLEFWHNEIDDATWNYALPSA